MEEHLTTSDWERQTFTFDFLKKAGVNDQPQDMVGWLKRIEVIPAGVRKFPRMQERLVEKDAIPAGYLAAMAYEWDSWGGGATTRQFLSALEFQVRGSKKQRIAESALTV
jgi:hypothetical protein